MRMRVRPLIADDQSWKHGALVRTWGSTAVARKAALVDAAELPGFVAEVDGQPAGLVTYARRGDEVEIVTIQVDQEGRGVGRALMDAVASHARQEGVRRIWLSTTNDNLRAVAFYQRWGMDLVALVRDGVAASRVVKPSIPMVGSNGIPIRHELELELLLDHS
jgi:ribosomal protein S18 acetylase RimI-like enzyme